MMQTCIPIGLTVQDSHVTHPTCVGTGFISALEKVLLVHRSTELGKLRAKEDAWCAEYALTAVYSNDGVLPSFNK